MLVGTSNPQPVHINTPCIRTVVTERLNAWQTALRVDTVFGVRIDFILS